MYLISSIVTYKTPLTVGFVQYEYRIRAVKLELRDNGKIIGPKWPGIKYCEISK